MNDASRGLVLKDVHAIALLVAVTLLSRLPFLGTFYLVSYDGTYYLSEAKALFAGEVLPGAFPIGYPFVVGLVQLVARDLELSGRIVSLLAGVGSVVVVYRLARIYLNHWPALLGALLLAINPLFIRMSLMTVSESVYVFWLLLGLWLVLRERYLLSGIALGAAVITRPEALAVVALVALFKPRKPARVVALLLPVVVIYGANTAVMSRSLGRLAIISKESALDSHTQKGRQQESVAGATSTDIQQQLEERLAHNSYVERLPQELLTLLRHVFPVVFLLALFGIVRMRMHVFLAALPFFFVYPLVTTRSFDRFVLPYVPILILYAVIGADKLGSARLRRGGYALLAVAGLALPFVNRAQLTEPEEAGLEVVRRAGIAMRDVVRAGDAVADRKPFFAFYAGGDYVQIPVAYYDDVMRHLCENDIEWLALHKETIHKLRPALRPLMYNAAVIRGETRFEQAHFDPQGEMVFRRVRDRDPLRWSRVSDAQVADIMPSFSPDGSRIAFRSLSADGSGAIYIAAANGPPRRLTVADQTRDPLAWSPDGQRIAFAMRSGGSLDIFAVNVATGEREQLTTDASNETSPSWAADDELVFASDRAAGNDVWSLDVRTGTARQLTRDAGVTFPVASPAGDRVAWIREGSGVFVMDRNDGFPRRLPEPTKVAYAPAWSPDGETLAVTAEDWGSWDVYLVKADGSGALLLTKTVSREGMPNWHADRIVLMSDREGDRLSIWTIDNLAPYLTRVDRPVSAQVFNAP